MPKLEARRLRVAEAGATTVVVVKVREVVIFGRVVLMNRGGQIYCARCEGFVHREHLSGACGR